MVIEQRDPYFYDVIIIGAGVVGCAIARELSKYKLRIAVLEKNPDVGLETSCRNSGVLHSGIHYKYGTLRARLCVRGNFMMDNLCKNLKVKIKRIGKLTIAYNRSEVSAINLLMEQGIANGVKGLKVLNSAEIQNIQPGLNAVAAIWSPSSAIISPFNLTIALAENALANGVDFLLNTRVTELVKLPGSNNESGTCRHLHDSLFNVKTQNNLKLTSTILINSAGLHSGDLSCMAGINKGQHGESLRIWPCRGEYYVLDKKMSGSIKTLIYPVPGSKDAGLGIHLTPTVEGNILIGPSANYIDEQNEDYRVTASVLQDLRDAGTNLLPELSMRDFIRSFAGNRPKRTSPTEGGCGDFVIEDREDLNGFINLVGIESPGLTSSPAIAELVSRMIDKHIPLIGKKDFIATRPGIIGHFSELGQNQQITLLDENPEYGEIICRCEKITKKEVRDAIENPLGAKSLVSIKYRARSGMGRCQGGFCTPRIVRMLRDEYGYKIEDFILRDEDSKMFSNNIWLGSHK